MTILFELFVVKKSFCVYLKLKAPVLFADRMGKLILQKVTPIFMEDPTMEMISGLTEFQSHVS